MVTVPLISIWYAQPEICHIDTRLCVDQLCQQLLRPFPAPGCVSRVRTSILELCGFSHRYWLCSQWVSSMITPSNGNFFRVTIPLCGEFTGPLTKPNDAEMFLICAWTNGWMNNREAGGLWRHRTHYDVTVMTIVALTLFGGQFLPVSMCNFQYLLSVL